MLKTKQFGRIVREARERRLLTLEALSEACDMSIRGLEKIELGDSDPKLSSVITLASALELDIGVLKSCSSQKTDEYAVNT